MQLVVADESAVSGEAGVVPIVNVVALHLIASLVGALAVAPCLIIPAVGQKLVPDASVGRDPHPDIRVLLHGCLLFRGLRKQTGGAAYVLAGKSWVARPDEHSHDKRGGDACRDQRGSRQRRSPPAAGSGTRRSTSSYGARSRKAVTSTAFSSFMRKIQA